MIRSGTAAICLIFLFGSSATSAATADPLRNGFADPPDAARPRVWWHWLNGNITKEGITLDLEWMKRIGIGGAESFQGFLGTMGPGKVVDKQLPYMSDGWQDAMHHAAVTADRLGLELGIAASPGWSESAESVAPPLIWLAVIAPWAALLAVVFAAVAITGLKFRAVLR